MTESCENCRFSADVNIDTKETHGVRTLACRRHPPTGGVYFAVFPLVRLEDWCGEYQRKEQTNG
jgi:hypothetical protein